MGGQTKRRGPRAQVCSSTPMTETSRHSHLVKHPKRLLSSTSETRKYGCKHRVCMFFTTSLSLHKHAPHQKTENNSSNSDHFQDISHRSYECACEGCKPSFHVQSMQSSSPSSRILRVSACDKREERQGSNHSHAESAELGNLSIVKICCSRYY